MPGHQKRYFARRIQDLRHDKLGRISGSDTELAPTRPAPAIARSPIIQRHELSISDYTMMSCPNKYEISNKQTQFKQKIALNPKIYQ
jgi:hypothetical protein